MTKKDCEDIADVVKDSIRPDKSVDRISLIMGLCIIFKKDNPKFKKDLFVDRCMENIKKAEGKNGENK